MTLLCVPIFVDSIEQAKRDMALAAEAGADLVELRIDHFDDAVGLKQILDDAIVRCIVTCRPTWEGGFSEKLDDERRDLLYQVLTPGANGIINDYIDIELVTARRLGLYRLPELTS